LYKPEGQSFPPVPQSPSKDDAIASLKELKALIIGFPYVTEADRSVALSGFLTYIDRRTMATAPMHAFTAPAPGTGKSLKVDLFSIVATGRPQPVIAQGKDEVEFEKRLGAALLAGSQAISVDNCEHPLESAFLCQALTQALINVRVLGLSQQVEIPNNAVIFANGNNLVLVGDLVRRALLCSMDAKVERPELRTFNIDAKNMARANRARLVVAALTILRAWHLARGSGVGGGLAPFGGFEDWSKRAREALVWLGCGDPCETVEKVPSNDPKRDALQMIVTQWRNHLGVDSKHTVQDVINKAMYVADFNTALLSVASNMTGHAVSNDRLGRWLRKVQGKVVDGLKFSCDGMKDGYPLWKLTKPG
jgi:hypothetical protein